MVLVDTVYQRVLALANKEQRGYVTPQEFNLFANQAQMDIFEQYFYDINQFGRMPGNGTEYSDMTTMLNEKISIFKKRDNVLRVGGFFPLPIDLYRLGTVYFGSLEDGVEITEVNYDDLPYLKSELTRPTTERPIYVNREEGLRVYPTGPITVVNMTYIRRPHKVNWGYVVLNDKALYNSNTSSNFEIHPGDETELVLKILTLAGITLEDQILYQEAQAEDFKNVQQEKQ